MADNPYVAIIADETKSDLRQSISNAADFAPDAESEIKRLGRVYGLPAATVRNELPTIKRRAEVDSYDYDAIVRDTPATARYLANPENAKVARDDLDTLSAVENVLRGMGERAGALGAGFGRFAFTVVDPLADTLADLTEGVGLPSVVEFGPNGIQARKRTAKERGDTGVGAAGGLVQMGEQLKLGYKPQTTWEDFKAQPLKSFFPFAIEQGLVSVPDMAAVIVNLPAYIGARTGEIGQTRAQNDQREDATVGDFMAAAPAAVGSALLERLGTRGILGLDDAARAFKDVPAAVAKAAGKEAVTEAGQETIESIGETAGTKAGFDPLQTAERAAAGAVGGAGFGGAARAVTAPMQAVEGALRRAEDQVSRAMDATAQSESLTALEQFAAASKLRERDPQSFKEFIDEATANGPVPDVYVSAQGLAQSGVDLEQLAALSPSVESQLQDAIATGGDVRIPVGEFATFLAGSDLSAQLMPHLRTDPGGFSQTEAQEFMATQGEALQADVETVMVQAVDREAFQASTDKVHDYFLEQLNTAGRFTPDVNSAYATMTASFYAVTAGRLGITPEEMLARYPLRIVAEGRMGGAVLDQEGDQLFHGSRTVGLDELQPGERGALGPGVYLTPNENVAKRYGDAVYGALEPAGIFQGIKSRDSSVNPYQVWRDQAERLVDANPEHADGIRDLMASLQPDDGYPLFKRLAQLVGSEQGAQDLFRNAGFTGISGTADGPEVVVFDPVTVDVLNQQARGQFSPATSTITLLKNADLSTFLHESGHFYLETLADIASQPDAPAEIKSDMDAVLSWFGSMNAPKASGSGPLNQAMPGLRDVRMPDSEYLATVLNSNFENGRIVGPQTVSMGELTDALVGSENDLRRVDDLAARIGGDEGYFERIIVDQDGNVVEGQHRVNALRKLGVDQVPIVRVRDLDAGFPTRTVKNAIEASKDTHSDHVNQIAGNLAEIYADENGDMAEVRLYDPPRGFAVQWDAAVNALEKALSGEAPLEQQGEQGAPGEGPMTLERWRAMSLDEQRFYHEAFARGFEAYLFEGKAPSNALRGVFQRFAAWMRNIYREITRLKVDLTDDVRGVFDRMLASAAQIEEQAAADSIVPMFQTAEEAGMTPEAFADYQNEATAAMATAMGQLQTRSLRDMKWLSGAKDRAVRKLQREADDKRKAIRAEVAAEVGAEPVNRARTFLKRGTDPDGQPVEGPHKLSLPALRDMFEGVPDELQDWKALGYGRYGMLAEEGLHPDVVAEAYGFASGEALVEALLNAEPMAEKIAGITDQRMLERYGDLTDEDAIAAAADQALHNDARLKFVATEANALATAAGRPRVLAKAAKDYAAAMIGRLRVKDVRPYRYRAAETRAAIAADKARKKGDLITATVEKRNQLINAYATRAAYDTQAEVEKAVNAWRRIVAGKDEALARNRDMDLVNAARAVLAAYGVGRKKNDVSGYITTLQRLNPALYADIEPFLTRAAMNTTNWQEVSVEDFRGLRDTVAQLWFLSKRNRQMEVDGQLVDRKAVASELAARLDERGVPDVAPGELEDATTAERALRALSGFRASARRVESWVRKIDAADTGPWRKYVWQPISEPANDYLLAQRDYLKRFLALTQALGPIKSAKIAAPEIGYTFKDKGRLLHAILHTGNPSNKRKLLLGRGWASETAEGELDTTRWDTFVARMQTEGRLSKADYDFAQAVWDLLDETKDGAQRAHRAVYGRYFEEITAERFDTPYGSYRGGYVPALTDSFLTQDAAMRQQQEALTEGDASMFPGPSKGFTKSRVDYNKQLALDLRLIPQHIDKVLKFTYFAAPTQDAVRLLKEKALSGKLEAYDPVAQTDLLLPWLNRAAKQIVEAPMPQGTAGRAFGTAMRALRGRTGLGVMFLNVANTLQQLTGFSVSAVRVKPGLLATAMVRYVQNPAEMTLAMRGASALMRTRSDSQVYETRQLIDDLLLDPTTFEKAQQFASRHGYVLQTMFQNVVDTITWHGAHEQAIARGDTPLQAVRFADSVVRETQGSMRPEDVARFETGNAFARLFTQFAGYFNMMANLQGTEFSITAQTMGLRKGAGRMFYVYAMGFAVPAIVSELIVQAMRGSLDDDDGEEGYLDDWLDTLFGSQLRFGTAMIPVAGQVANLALGYWNDKVYDDRLSTPVVGMIEKSARAPNSVYKAIAEDGDLSTAIKDTLSLMTLLTGIPFQTAARPAGYAADVLEGDVQPTSTADAVRGLVSGASSPDSRD